MEFLVQKVANERPLSDEQKALLLQFANTFGDQFESVDEVHAGFKVIKEGQPAVMVGLAAGKLWVDQEAMEAGANRPGNGIGIFGTRDESIVEAAEKVAEVIELAAKPEEE